MIVQIRGTVLSKQEASVFIDVGGLTYEVFIPAVIMQRIDEMVAADNTIKLVTYHYLQTDPSKSRPILIGFGNEIEKEFFEQFITVSGIGPRAALKALNQPISRIAQAIDEQDEDFLCSLPGVGRQRSREIIAKLQNKVGKFGLLRDTTIPAVRASDDSVKQEALHVLLRLQYKAKEAHEMIERALKRAPHVDTLEQLLNEIYKQSKP
jgi:Holliday junction DNA helicase RuvA